MSIAPHWEMWRSVPKVKLQEAVALSCGIAPSEVGLVNLVGLFSTLRNSSFAPGESTEYSRRLIAARNSVGPGGTLPTIEGTAHQEVNLRTFASWAMTTMRWNCPEEFAALVDAGLPAADAKRDMESRGQRRERLAARRAELKQQGVRDFSRRVAEEEGISESRLRQLLSENPIGSKSIANKGSPFDRSRS